MNVSDAQLKREYRKESSRVMEECLNDAKETARHCNWSPQAFPGIVAATAQALFDKRMKPYHYWQQHRKKELIMEDEQ